MDINVETLISEIYARPVLWDKKNKLYHNRVIVAKSWKTIAADMETPRDQLKKKWKIIRDQFRNECKKLPTVKPGEEGAAPVDYDMYITWPHFKSLLFLKDQMRVRKPCGNESEDSIPQNRDEPSQLSMKGIFCAPYKRAAVATAASSTLATPKKKRNVANELTERGTTAKPTDDSCRMFLLSLLPDVQRLSEGALRQFKIQTMVLLDDMLTQKHEEPKSQPAVLPNSTASATYELSASYEPMSPVRDGVTSMKIENEQPIYEQVMEGIM